MVYIYIEDNIKRQKSRSGDGGTLGGTRISCALWYYELSWWLQNFTLVVSVKAEDQDRCLVYFMVLQIHLAIYLLVRSEVANN